MASMYMCVVLQGCIASVYMCCMYVVSQGCMASMYMCGVSEGCIASVYTCCIHVL